MLYIYSTQIYSSYSDDDDDDRGVEYHLHIHIYIYTKLVSSMSFMLHVTYKGGYLSTTIIFHMYIYTHK